MPSLDNHIDELFQKATENYPLKTGAGNFDDLMPFIAGETATPANPVGSTKGKRKTALLLLAFLVISGTTYLISSKSSDNIATTDKVIVQDLLHATPQNKTAPQINMNAPVTGNATAENENIFQKNKLSSLSKTKFFAKISQGFAATDDMKNIGQIDNKVVKTNKTGIGIINSQQINNGNVTPEFKKEIMHQPEQKKELLKEEKITTNQKDKKKRNKSFIYYGITAGVELNQVKNQGMTKPGLNGGILVGVQINKKLSVETGFQLSQKKYYSQGKYFNTKTGSMPSNMTVNSLVGMSTLIEIPVSVKYNFSEKKNTFYGKAGVSSYLMTKENNKYQAVVSGQQQEINSTYKKSNQYPVAAINISAGYQYTIGKKFNIRAAPYIQIPLKGIGIGALPVTSTGLQLVLTRD